MSSEYPKATMEGFWDRAVTVFKPSQLAQIVPGKEGVVLDGVRYAVAPRNSGPFVGRGLFLSSRFDWRIVQEPPWDGDETLVLVAVRKRGLP